MNFRHTLREIKRILTPPFGWTQLNIHTVPTWVQSAMDRKMYKRGYPWAGTFHFKGKSFIYRVKFHLIGQGDWDATYYSKKRSYIP